MLEKQVILSLDNINVEASLNGKNIRILKNISFKVFRGDIVGIIGESGSGKTLTALSIMGMLRKNIKITSGTITFMGDKLIGNDYIKKIKICASMKKDISMIFQESWSSLSPIYKIYSQMKDIIGLHNNINKSELHNKCNKLLYEVGFNNPEQIGNKYPFELSGGMLQRVILAIAISMDPKILIADEPTASLNLSAQRENIILLKRFQKKLNNSIIIITHDFSILKSICNYVIVIKDGEILEKNAVENILHNPKHDYTKQLVISQSR